MDRGTKYTFSRQYQHENRLNMTNYQGNANEITMKCHQALFRITIFKKTTGKCLQ